MPLIDRSKLTTTRGYHYSFALRPTDEVHFDKLTADQLRVLKLLHHEKMSYDEIERYTGWPPGTIRSRSHRGRNIIKQARLAADAALEQTGTGYKDGANV